MHIGEARCMHIGEARCMHIGEVRCMHIGEVRCMHIGEVRCMHVGSAGGDRVGDHLDEEERQHGPEDEDHPRLAKGVPHSAGWRVGHVVGEEGRKGPQHRHPAPANHEAQRVVQKVALDLLAIVPR